MKWERVELGEVVENLDSQRVPLNKAQRDELKAAPKYPYIGANGILDYIDDYIFDQEILCIAEDGGSWGQNEKCCSIYQEKCWVNNHAHVLASTEQVHLKFLMYFLNFSNLNKYITGSTRGKLTKRSLNSIQIPLPPLSEQRRLAARLDKADAVRQKSRALVEAYAELGRSVFLEVFGDPVRNERGWEEFKLNDVCTKITDGTHHSPPLVEKGIPYVTARHIRRNLVDFKRAPTYVSKEDHGKIYSRCNPEKGDILYIKDGATTGVAAINPFDEEFSMLSSLALLKPDKDKITSHYLSYWLNEPRVKEKMLRNMSGAAIRRFTLKKIKNFAVLLPPLPLQTRFAAMVANIEAQRRLAERQLAAAEAVFGGVLQGTFER